MSLSLATFPEALFLRKQMLLNGMLLNKMLLNKMLLKIAIENCSSSPPIDSPYRHHRNFPMDHFIVVVIVFGVSIVFVVGGPVG